MITATASISNKITGDTFVYDWSRTNNVLPDQTVNKVDEIFQVDPSLLDAGNYNITVAATNTLATSGLTSVDKVISVKIVLPQQGGGTQTDTGAAASSGGCSLSTRSTFDPILLILISIFAIGFRVRKKD